jgi:hypothetical protein
MTNYLIAALKAYGVDCLRIDFNISPGPFWQFLDKTDPNRVGAKSGTSRAFTKCGTTFSGLAPACLLTTAPAADAH